MPVLIFNPVEGRFDFVLGPGEGAVEGETPSGVKNGVNTTYTTANKFVHEASGGRTAKVYVNGQRFGAPSCPITVGESGGPGTGFDQVVLPFAPIPTDEILVDYWRAG